MVLTLAKPKTQCALATAKYSYTALNSQISIFYILSIFYRFSSEWCAGITVDPLFSRAEVVTLVQSSGWGLVTVTLCFTNRKRRPALNANTNFLSLLSRTLSAIIMEFGNVSNCSIRRNPFLRIEQLDKQATFA